MPAIALPAGAYILSQRARAQIMCPSRFALLEVLAVSRHSGLHDVAAEDRAREGKLASLSLSCLTLHSILPGQAGALRFPTGHCANSAPLASANRLLPYRDRPLCCARRLYDRARVLCHRRIHCWAGGTARL